MASQPESKHPRSVVNRSPVFYGWVIWLVAAVGMSSSMPGQTASISLFIDRWITDFGLENRSTISALYGFGTFTASLALTFIGNRIDKHGTRFMGVVISVLFVIALIYMSFVNNLVMLFVGFVLIRGLGQGSIFLVSTTAVNNWFLRWRGRVMAFGLLGYNLFQRWYIPAVQGTLESTPWEGVWLILAAGIGLVTLPLMGILMRQTPELFGERPDGDSRKPKTEIDVDENEPEPKEASYTLREAMRLPLFWVFLLGGLLSPAFITGVVFHQESLFGLANYDAATAANTIANGLLLGGVSMLVTGFLVDRVPPAYVRAMELSALGSLLVLSAWLGLGQAALYAWVVLFGIVNGTGGVFNGAVYANIFGRSHQGEIRGFVSTTGVTATAAGPFLLALSYDAFGDYSIALYAGAALAFVAMIGGLVADGPRRGRARADREAHVAAEATSQ